MPARPQKPRDKAIVEHPVLIAERWIVAALRHHKFYSLAEANEAIANLLEKLNHRPFRKREARVPAYSLNWISRHCSHCRPSTTCWPFGRPSVPPSITTWRWTVIITAFPTNWLAKSWKLVTPPPR